MAMDARTGDLKWEYKRKYPEGVNGGTNRNMAMWGNTLIDAGADNSLYAVDARTGNLVWESQILKAGVRANASSGPIIANGKVTRDPGRIARPGVRHHGGGSDGLVVQSSAAADEGTMADAHLIGRA